nr:3-methyladenine DNA glycosylase [Brevibacterium daeguense]
MAVWHPGAGRRVELLTDDDAAVFDRRWYRSSERSRSSTGASDSEAIRFAEVDLDAWWADRGDGAQFIAGLLWRTMERPGTFGCFGMHEWAMVYRQRTDEHRHTQVPLRLTQRATDAVVESHRIKCSHFDAYRFFTPQAQPRNELRPTRAGMQDNEQPGCLHAGMDLYKWAMKLVPVLPSELTLEAFDLARDIRVLDMEASPYDLRDWGYGVVAVETAEGKAEYVERQREFSRRGQLLRERMLTELERIPHLRR